MFRSAKLACIMLGFILPATASADELSPLRAGTFSLDEHTASVYYTVKDGDFEVVTTVASGDGQEGPMRCTSQLAPGQTATVSVGNFGTDLPATTLRFERAGDTLHADMVPPAEIAAR